MSPGETGMALLGDGDVSLTSHHLQDTSITSSRIKLDTARTIPRKSKSKVPNSRLSAIRPFFVAASA